MKPRIYFSTPLHQTQNKRHRQGSEISPGGVSQIRNHPGPEVMSCLTLHHTQNKASFQASEGKPIPLSRREDPCHSCKFFKPLDFCLLLPWNDTRYNTPLQKYIAWAGEPCPPMQKGEHGLQPTLNQYPLL